MNEDIKIAQSIKLEDIENIAQRANISSKYLEKYGKKFFSKKHQQKI